ncbi:MAG: transcription antitermination factor NusB [Deltaproteobacteria bacterium RIFCSPLOWO2_02_FULL_53_8]|nr:MAG: transcription antitermination factor NusB [Deltaproteobacteria bacterium RIFCSPLOWO2_02_FULL_53_8]
MNSRHKARETALQILYNVDISGCALNEAIDSHLDGMREASAARRYCDALVKGVMAERSVIDGIINECSENWTVDRMPLVDRNILRIAVYELEHLSDVPFKVVIDEAVELAKRFGSEESGAFVNGILDKARKGGQTEDKA